VKVTISKRQWEMIGKKTGWITSASNLDSYVASFNSYVDKIKKVYWSQKSNLNENLTERGFVINVLVFAFKNSLVSLQKAINTGNNELSHYISEFGIKDLQNKLSQLALESIKSGTDTYTGKETDIMANCDFSQIDKVVTIEILECNKKHYYEKDIKQKNDLANACAFGSLSALIPVTFNDLRYAADFGDKAGTLISIEKLGANSLLNKIVSRRKENGYGISEHLEQHLKTQPIQPKDNEILDTEEYGAYDPSEIEKHFGN